MALSRTSSRTQAGSLRFAPTLLAAWLLGFWAAIQGAAQDGGLSQAAEPVREGSGTRLFDRDNLLAWCIVPFDSRRRGPQERAEMLSRLGFRHFAYDWRAEHIPSFDAEIEALKERGITLDAFWVAPGELNPESRRILDLLRRHGIRAQLWVILDLGPDLVQGEEQKRRVETAAAKLRPLAEAAAAIGCTVGLYNHGGWFGEPENQIAVIERLRAEGSTNVGIVYNLHHGHDHLDRFPELLRLMRPYLLALNLNGMDPGGDRVGRKILPLGQGERDLELLRAIRESGYQGLIGILGHTMDDAEDRLRDNLDGLDWLVPQLEGKPAGPRPRPRTPVPDRPAGSDRPDGGAAAATFGSPLPETPEQIVRFVEEARTHGDPARGAGVFLNPRFGCVSCHRIGDQGGTVGPELTAIGRCLSGEEIAESVFWPARKIKEGFEAIAVALADGRVLQGYPLEELGEELRLRLATTGEILCLSQEGIEERRAVGTLMPEGIAASMSDQERLDLLRFLMELGGPGSVSVTLAGSHPHTPLAFPFDREPLQPDRWPNRNHPVNRDRLYDFYAKEAEFFTREKPGAWALLPPFPGLDGSTHGHWGNQNEETWVDARWNQSDLGSVLSGVFHGPGVTVPKGVCVRLGDQGTLSVCFNPETLCYEALWRGGFVKFSPTRHGFLDGLLMDGEPLPRPEGTAPSEPFVYHGFYRHGNRVIFSYRIGDREFLDSPWEEEGRFQRLVGPADRHPLAAATRGGPPRWPQELVTRGSLGHQRPYAIDTITPPFDNPWRSLLFFGDLDFRQDGSAFLCTMQGDVWLVRGIDDRLQQVIWRKYASGLHQALGLVVVDDQPWVLGRDQITRLHDLNGDGEADFHECVSNAYETSPAGHDFICGLQRDPAGNLYTVSSKQGLLRIPPRGQPIEVLATGFRNPDGLGLSSQGVITVPNSEGDWVPASMVCEIRPGGHYGYRGPRDGKPPDLPLVYLPRGLDNSSGAQVEISSDRWGPLAGHWIHLSYGAGTHFLLLRETVDGQPQGAVVPLGGDFLSGVHRGRFHPTDGQLYVIGMGGWGTYTAMDGCFQRVRYTGDPVQLPTAFHAHENGVLLRFSRPLDPAIAADASRQFAQVWNYRYSSGYGSPELSTRHPAVPGHDPLAIRSAHVLTDGQSLFLEIPDLQPVNQLHLHLRVDSGLPIDVFATIHRLAPPFTGFPGFQSSSKLIAAHPILRDLALLNAKKLPNPWRDKIPGARELKLEAQSNLSYSASVLHARAGEAIKLTFANPDVVPHNWALIRPGTLPTVGNLVNQIVAEPEAELRHYIPRTNDILVHTDIVEPGREFTIWFRAPAEPGRYPFLCTFPGHWMVMNGVMIVEEEADQIRDQEGS